MSFVGRDGKIKPKMLQIFNKWFDLHNQNGKMYGTDMNNLYKYVTSTPLEPSSPLPSAVP